MAKKRKSPRQKAAGRSASASRAQAGRGRVNAEKLLRSDHRQVEKLVKQFESARNPTRRKELAGRICADLVIHSMLEEHIFYPACREANVASDLLDEAQVEHDTVKMLIADVQSREPDDPYYDARMTVLSEYVKHHVKEEEKAGSGIFAKARKAGVDMTALGARIQERKQRLTEKVGDRGIAPPPPRALQIDAGAFERERTEPGGSLESEKDEQRLFIDEDEDGGRGMRGGGRRGAEGERGWHGDSRGHSIAARRGARNRH